MLPCNNKYRNPCGTFETMKLGHYSVNLSDKKYYWSSYEGTWYCVIISAANETYFPMSHDWIYYTVIDI